MGSPNVGDSASSGLGLDVTDISNLGDTTVRVPFVNTLGGIDLSKGIKSGHVLMMVGLVAFVVWRVSK